VANISWLTDPDTIRVCGCCSVFSRVTLSQVTTHRQEPVRTTGDDMSLSPLHGPACRPNRPTGGPKTPTEYEAFFLSNLTLIDQVVASVARRHHLSSADVEDFRSTVYVRLIQDDYATLRKFEGRSSLRTYLTSVIGRLLLDQRNSTWGKWRPSAVARRGGELAIQLEKLTLEGVSFEHACDMLESARGQAIDRRALRDIFDRFPRRAGRYFVSEETIALHPTPHSAPDAGLARDARRRAIETACLALAIELRALAPADRQFLRLRYVERRTISGSAHQICDFDTAEVKGWYRRLQRLLATLRRGLERRGVFGRDVLAILGSPDLTVPTVLGHAERGVRGSARDVAWSVGILPAVLLASSASERVDNSVAHGL
jgi:RNA polymerase sigma factor (sigma-70 family)